MNITPELIPDEVVEAAVSAWHRHPDCGTVQSMYTAMAAALAAALPVLFEELLSGQISRLGDDEDGQPRVVVQTTREAIQARAKNLLFRKVLILLMPEVPSA